MEDQIMADSMREILNPNLATEKDPAFPHAPEGWTEASAAGLAREEGIELTSAHWEVVRALQEYFTRNETPHVRELHDALDEKFHSQGGIKYLYGLFPGGPVAQGCRLAGLQPPAGAIDKSFGSVQ
jgi:tRNA 2-thiouridine synthesizing protein E